MMIKRKIDVRHEQKYQYRSKQKLNKILIKIKKELILMSELNTDKQCYCCKKCIVGPFFKAYCSNKHVYPVHKKCGYNALRCNQCESGIVGILFWKDVITPQSWNRMIKCYEGIINYKFNQEILKEGISRGFIIMNGAFGDKPIILDKSKVDLIAEKMSDKLYVN